MAYEIVVIAPTAADVASLVAGVSAGLAWGKPVDGVAAATMPEGPTYAVIMAPKASRDALDQAFPGSPWMHAANGINALAKWRWSMSLGTLFSRDS